MVLHALVLSCKCCFCICFTTSPLKCTTCNKAMIINSVLLSSWVPHVVLNYKCPICLWFSWIFLNFLEFSSVKSSKVFTAHCILGGTNFRNENNRPCKGSVFVFYWCKKCLVDFLENWAQTKQKFQNIYFQSAKFYRISPKEMWENALSVVLFVLMMMP